MQYEKLKYRKKENAYPKSAKRQRDDARRQDMISYAEQELLESIVKKYEQVASGYLYCVGKGL